MLRARGTAIRSIVRCVYVCNAAHSVAIQSLRIESQRRNLLVFSTCLLMNRSVSTRGCGQRNGNTHNRLSVGIQDS